MCMKSTRRSHRHQLVLGLEPGPQRPAFTPQDPLLLQTMADLLLQALGLPVRETGVASTTMEAVDEPETHL